MGSRRRGRNVARVAASQRRLEGCGRASRWSRRLGRQRLASGQRRAQARSHPERRRRLLGLRALASRRHRPRGACCGCCGRWRVGARATRASGRHAAAAAANAHRQRPHKPTLAAHLAEAAGARPHGVAIARIPRGARIAGRQAAAPRPPPLSRGDARAANGPPRRLALELAQARKSRSPKQIKGPMRTRGSRGRVCLFFFLKLY